MSETSVDTLRDAIRELHGCESTWVAAVLVLEQHEGRDVWRGTVEVFDLVGHTSASRCYAWSHATQGGRRKFYAVLHAPPVDSATAAVRAAIVSDYRTSSK